MSGCRGAGTPSSSSALVMSGGSVLITAKLRGDEWNSSRQQTSMAITHCGSLDAKSITVWRRMRRRSTTVRVAFNLTTLQTQCSWLAPFFLSTSFLADAYQEGRARAVAVTGRETLSWVTALAGHSAKALPARRRRISNRLIPRTSRKM